MFLNTLKSKPEFTFELLQIKSYFIKQTDEKIFEMGQKTLEQRAAKLVHSMKDFFELYEQSYIDILLRRKDMANFIGVATESFIRKLGQFQKRGLIKTKGKKLKFLIRRHFYEYLQASVNLISKSKGIHLSLIR
jgi:CRP-like cAMP-binding protein